MKLINFKKKEVKGTYIYFRMCACEGGRLTNNWISFINIYIVNL